MAFHISLDVYDGPMDLLLQLVSREQVDIRDISLSRITDQYLQVVRELGLTDMERASEFLELAARLLQIKARRLLPGTQDDPDQPTAEELEQALLHQVEEYRLFRHASDQLREREALAARIYRKLPEELVHHEQIEFDNADARLLMQTLAHLLARAAVEEDEPAPPERPIDREHFSVQEQLFRIQRLLESQGKLRFFELIGEQPRREVIVTVFLALLELTRLRRIHIRQDGLYQDIDIVSADAASGREHHAAQ